MEIIHNLVVGKESNIKSHKSFNKYEICIIFSDGFLCISYDWYFKGLPYEFLFRLWKCFERGTAII